MTTPIQSSEQSNQPQINVRLRCNGRLVREVSLAEIRNLSETLADQILQEHSRKYGSFFLSETQIKELDRLLSTSVSEKDLFKQILQQKATTSTHPSAPIRKTDLLSASLDASAVVRNAASTLSGLAATVTCIALGILGGMFGAVNATLIGIKGLDLLKSGIELRHLSSVCLGVGNILAGLAYFVVGMFMALSRIFEAIGSAGVIAAKAAGSVLTYACIPMYAFFFALSSYNFMKSASFKNDLCHAIGQGPEGAISFLRNQIALTEEQKKASKDSFVEKERLLKINWEKISRKVGDDVLVKHMSSVINLAEKIDKKIPLTDQDYINIVMICDDIRRANLVKIWSAVLNMTAVLIGVSALIVASVATGGLAILLPSILFIISNIIWFLPDAPKLLDWMVARIHNVNTGTDEWLITAKVASICKKVQKDNPQLSDDLVRIIFDRDNSQPFDEYLASVTDPLGREWLQRLRDKFLKTGCDLQSLQQFDHTDLLDPSEADVFLNALQESLKENSRFCEIRVGSSIQDGINEDGSKENEQLRKDLPRLGTVKCVNAQDVSTELVVRGDKTIENFLDALTPLIPDESQRTAALPILAQTSRNQVVYPLLHEVGRFFKSSRYNLAVYKDASLNSFQITKDGNLSYIYKTSLNLVDSSSNEPTTIQTLNLTATYSLVNESGKWVWKEPVVLLEKQQETAVLAS